MGKNLICIFPFLVLFACFTHSIHAYQFIVGGKDGWVSNPSENYIQWAERNRFSVNDTLLFKYTKGIDSVLVVNKDDYDNCNTGNPILKLDDGNSVFTFDRSGPFYFISGNKDNCDKGQKLVIVVLAVRNRPTPPPNTPSPAAAPPNGSLSTPPASSPSSSSPSPAAEPPSEGSPAPAASPDQSPSPSPAAQPPSEGSPAPAASPDQSSSPSPAAQPPSEGSPAPVASPDQSPSPANHGSGPSTSAISPGTNSSPPSSTTPGSPDSSTPATGNTPADSNAPGGSSVPRSFVAPACSTPSVILVSAVSLVLSLILGG